MDIRNRRDVKKRIAKGEIFAAHLAYYVADMLYIKKRKPPREAPQHFHDTHKLFEESGHIESLQTTKQEQDAIFDKEMAQFYENPTQFYNTHEDDPTWIFSATNHRVRKRFEHHHMERWFDLSSCVGRAHIAEKEWKAFGFDYKFVNVD
jgi:hypothetical protein